MNLGAAIGEAVRRARGTRTQEELAAHARSRGLNWSRGAVAALETGRRDVSAGELLLLPAVLSTFTDELIELEDLFQGSGELEMAPGVSLPRGVIRQIVGGEGSAANKAVRRLVKDLKNLDLESIAEELQRPLAETKAAKKMGLGVEEVDRAARKRFGQGLTEERERRVQEAGAPTDKSALAALRRRITMELQKELWPPKESAERMVRDTREQLANLTKTLRTRGRR